MSFAQEPAYLGAFPTAADAPAVERLAFVRRTYAHLAGAVAAFVLLEGAILSLPGTERFVAQTIGRFGGYGMLVLLGGFILVSYIAQRWAQSTTSLATQYLGLALYVVAEAVIFLPLLLYASRFYPSVIPAAAIVTLTLFTALSFFVLTSRKDFSFLRPALGIASLVALGLVVAAFAFNFDLGIVFTIAMIGVACGYVLYDTSNVIHHYRTTQHVAAALALFASVALMFWYVIRLLMYLQDRR